MRGLVFIVYSIFLLLTGHDSGNVEPATSSFSHNHRIESALLVNQDDSQLVMDEMGDEDERISNALAPRYRLLPDLSLSLIDKFDLNYLHGFTKDRLALGDLPDIYITYRALRI
jgi:hypothetical protein